MELTNAWPHPHSPATPAPDPTAPHARRAEHRRKHDQGRSDLHQQQEVSSRMGRQRGYRLPDEPGPYDKAGEAAQHGERHCLAEKEASPIAVNRTRVAMPSTASTLRVQ